MRFKTTLFTVTASLALIAGEVYAASAGEYGEEKVGGLPQLDPSTYPSQLFWLAVTFVVLYLLFANKVLPDISNTIENRQELIKSDLETAESLKEEAEKIHQDYERILEESRQKAVALFDQVDADIKAKTEGASAEFRDRMQKEVQVAESRIEKAKSEAIKDIDGMAAEMASAAAKKIVGVSADIKQAKSVVKDINTEKQKAKAA